MAHSVRTDISATLALLGGSPDWRERMDVSIDGVWRSFLAFPIALPFLLLFYKTILVMWQSMPPEELPEVPDLPFWLDATIQIFGLVLIWSISLLILVDMARRFNWGKNFAPMLIAFNWSFLILQLPLTFLCVAMVSLEKPASIAVAILLSFFTRLWMRWRIFTQTETLASLSASGVVLFLEFVAFAIRLAQDAIIRLIYGGLVGGDGAN